MLYLKGKESLRFGYQFVAILQEDLRKNPNNEKMKRLIDDMKREIRAYTHKPISEERIVKDYGIDGEIVLIPLPERLTSLENAIEYFEDVEKLYYVPSPYDCTGQLFTNWYKVFKRNDRFYAYHSIGRDV